MRLTPSLSSSPSVDHRRRRRYRARNPRFAPTPARTASCASTNAGDDDDNARAAMRMRMRQSMPRHRRKQPAPTRLALARRDDGEVDDDASDGVIVIDDADDAAAPSKRAKRMPPVMMFSRPLRRRDRAPAGVVELGRCAVCARGMANEAVARTSSGGGVLRAVGEAARRLASVATRGDSEATFRLVDADAATTRTASGAPCVVEFVFDGDGNSETYGIDIGDQGKAFTELFVKFATRVDAWLSPDDAFLVVGLTSHAFACVASDAECHIPPQTHPGAFPSMAKFYSYVALVFDALSGASKTRLDEYNARRNAAAADDADPASEGLDLSAIFDAVRPDARRCPELQGEFPELLPRPRAYQSQAVAWMLARERASAAPAGALAAKRGASVEQDARRALHPLWRELPGGGTYINVFNGMLSATRFEIDEDYEDVRGGILADEMGLGKTVEIIMLVTANRREKEAHEIAAAEAVEAGVDEGEAFENAREGLATPTETPPFVTPMTSPAKTKSALKAPHASPHAFQRRDVPAAPALVAVDEKPVDDVGVVELPAKAPVKVEANNEEPGGAFNVDCVCGARGEDPNFTGIWMGCDKCGVWQHARCVFKMTKMQERNLQRMSNEEREKLLGEFLCSKCHEEYPDEDKGAEELHKPMNVNCVCGAREEDPNFTGLWMGCDKCGVWQHARCVFKMTKMQERNLQQISDEERDKLLGEFVCWKCNEEHPGEEELDEPMNVNCVCGAREEDPNFTGLWVGCDKCGVWQHARCVLKLPRAENILQQMPRKEREELLGDFLCGKCIVEYAGEEYCGPCGATLVVCPTPIFEQWHSELTRHVRPGALKIIRYEGQSRVSGSGGSTKDVFGPKQLAEADIVLTTYDTLRSEINIDISDGAGRAYAERARRYERKYEIVPTPLTRLKWWRVVLDEAQMVESTVSIAAIMVRRLPAVHRWAVTGTPISRGLGDIFGLLTFLCVPPFERDAHWWSRLIEHPYSYGDANAKRYLHKLLKELMWRNSREGVRDQLGIPPQGEIVTWLESSAVERHFYKTQFRECHSTASATLAHSDFANIDENQPLETRDARRLMGPLLRLRQACDHPQAGSYGLAGGIARAGANVLTMHQITDKLIEKARVEAEEAQRLVAFALNALGGLAWCENDLTLAISVYREVIQLEATGKERKIRLDAMQILHAKHNLNAALELVKAEPQLLTAPIARTMRDDDLGQDTQLLRDKYIYERTSGLCGAEREFADAKKDVEWEFSLGNVGERTNSAVNVGGTNGWWLEVLNLVDKFHMSRLAFNDRLRDQLDGRWQGKKIAFEDLSGLQLQMAMDLQEIDTARKALLDRMEELKDIVKSAPPERVREVGMCETCRAGTDFATPGVMCVFCHTEPLFETYERKIMGSQTLSAARPVEQKKQKKKDKEKEKGLPMFSRVGRKIGGEREETNRGGASAVETVLQMLLVSLRTRSLVMDAKQQDSYITAGKSHVNTLEAMRKEFYKASALFVQQRESMAARDELDMSAMRIRVREDYEIPNFGQPDPIPLALQGVVIHPYEVKAMKHKYTQEKATYDADMAKAASQLRYLENIRLPDRITDGKGEKSSIECPICLQDIVVQSDVKYTDMCVFPCGHSTCMECTQNLIRRSHPTHGCSNFDRRQVTCVSCRKPAFVHELNYVSTGTDDGVNQRTGFVRNSDDDFLNVMFGAPEAHLAGEPRVTVEGSWGTKIEAIVRRIKWLLSLNNDAKILVFSEFEDVLDVIQQAISRNSILFERATTGGVKLNVSLENFKKNANVHVLLLPLKRAAHGLNLTEAQHVILVEPVIDPGLEAQAIKRVDRIGQLKPTCVHRFIIRHSIEENVFKLARQRMDELSDIASDLSLSKRDEATTGLSLADIRRLIEIEDN